MNLLKWSEILDKNLFRDGAVYVRLYDADGFVLQQLYNENRPDGAPFLDKDSAAQDFFHAVIEGIFRHRGIAPWHKTGLRITEVADYFARPLSDGQVHFDRRLLALCYFFASVWSFEFQDEDDNGGNDSNYRRRRFSAALEWAEENERTVAANINCDLSPRFFSSGIVLLFNQLKTHKPALFMPAEDFEYGMSHADGITLSHAIFRYGEIAFLYNRFHDSGLKPANEYAQEFFRRFSENYFDVPWLKSRSITREALAESIQQLLRGWDGRPRERFTNFVPRVGNLINGGGLNVLETRAASCKAYWAVSSTANAFFNQWDISICLDKLTALAGDLVAEAGVDHVIIPSNSLDGMGYYLWSSNGDLVRGVSGWQGLRTNEDITFKSGGLVLDCDKLPAFNRCFDGHSVMLLQGYVPPAGGNPIWRLMVGRQGLELFNIWDGDGRPADTQYAIMSPRQLSSVDVVCCGETCALHHLGTIPVGDNINYDVYRLGGELQGDLLVDGMPLHTFDTQQTKNDAEEAFLSEQWQLFKLYDYNFAVTCLKTVFFIPQENRIAVYTHDVHDAPVVYAVSTIDIESCEVEPVELPVDQDGHKIALQYDAEKRLWLSDELDDVPYAIGMLLDGVVSFRLIPGVEDYRNSWRGYFLPKIKVQLERDKEASIKGDLITREMLGSIHAALNAPTVNNQAGEDLDDCSPFGLFEDRDVVDAPAKLQFISDIASPILQQLVMGQHRSAHFVSFRTAFNAKPAVVLEFIDQIPQNYHMTSLAKYYGMALLLLAVHNDRGGRFVQSVHLNFKRNLRDMRLSDKEYNDDGGVMRRNPLYRRHYYTQFLCEGIVHAILDGMSSEMADTVLSRGMSLAERIAGQLA